MNRNGDVSSTWGWGLRRYAWVVLLFVVGIGVLVPLAQARSADVYQAQSQVGPKKPLLLSNLDPLPRFAQSVFNDGAVAHAVRKLLRLPAGTTVIPARVQLIAPQDNPVMTVSGKAATAGAAQAVANQAATTFVGELNKYSGSVGTFAVQTTAPKPAKPNPKLVGGYRGVAVGSIAGLVAGCGVVGLVLVFRRPVVDASAAEAATGLSVLGSLPLPRRGPPTGEARMALGALSRRVLATQCRVVHVTGAFADQVNVVAAGIRDLVHSPLAQPRTEHEIEVPEVVAVNRFSLERWVGTPIDNSLTLVVIPQGIRARSLRTLVDRYASGSPTALVLVATQHRGFPFGFVRARKTALASQPG